MPGLQFPAAVAGSFSFAREERGSSPYDPVKVGASYGPLGNAIKLGPLSKGLKSTRTFKGKGQNLYAIPEHDFYDDGEDEVTDSTEVSDDNDVDPTDLTLHEKIGHGDHAEVFLATYRPSFGDEGHPTTVAVKKMHKNINNLGSEGLGLNATHPNLLKYYGTSMAFPPCLIVMEYCAGGSLYRHLHDPKSVVLTSEQRIKIMSDVAEGMAFLHANMPNMIRHGLKSANMLLARPVNSQEDEPQIKIADFQVVDLGAEESNGTAPQDEKTSVYSFAMLMYELITSKVLTPEDQNRWPDFNTMLRACDCPPQLGDIMRRCWSNDVSSRPSFAQIAQEVGNQLKLIKLYKMVKAGQKAK